MKLIFGFLFIVTLFKGNFASSATVPNTLLNLGGSLNGEYQNYLNGVGDLVDTCGCINDLNVSATLSASSISLLTVLKKIQQLSGPIDDVRNTFSNSLPNFFAIINQAFSNFGYVVGSTIGQIFLQEIALVQSAITSLASGDLINMSGTLIALVNGVQYLLLTADIVVILFANNLNDQYTNFFINAVIACDTLFVLKEYALFLNAAVVTDPTALNYINILAVPGTQGIGSAAQIILGATSISSSQSSLTANIAAALPQFVQLTFSFINAVASIPNAFSNSNFTYQQSLPADLEQIRVAFNQLGNIIANYSGADIYNIITSAF